jgi:hypothetical protein
MDMYTPAPCSPRKIQSPYSNEARSRKETPGEVLASCLHAGPSQTPYQQSTTHSLLQNETHHHRADQHLRSLLQRLLIFFATRANFTALLPSTSPVSAMTNNQTPTQGAHTQVKTLHLHPHPHPQPARTLPPSPSQSAVRIWQFANPPAIRPRNKRTPSSHSRAPVGPFSLTGNTGRKAQAPD